jgi:hypothetical protein
MKLADWNKLSAYLRRRSREICKDNNCTRDGHNCESYAYIRVDGTLIDICISDYFCGGYGPYAAIPMPWIGTGRELRDAVSDDAQ